MTFHVRPPIDGATNVPIRRAGCVAAELCKTPARAEVAAVFERSFYLRSGDRFICIGEPAIGNGPLTLIADMARLALRPGQPARVGENCIAIDAMTFTYDGRRPWHPPPWPQPATPRELTRTRMELARRAAKEAPAEGFGRTIATMAEPHDAFSRAARRRLARLESCLAAPTAAAASLSDAVCDLVGLGPGLTPSGDDVLIGALALLDALATTNEQASGACAGLAHAIARVPPGLTSPLSHCFLRTSAAGHIGEHLHAAVSSLVIGDIDGALAAARRIGHSSGWDMLAGIVTALDLVVRRDHAALRGR
jgi:hypothetical protein